MTKLLKNHWNYRGIEFNEFLSERGKRFWPWSGQAGDEVARGPAPYKNRTKDCFERLLLRSLSIRRFWGKGERWKRKKERAEGEKLPFSSPPPPSPISNLLSPSPLGRPGTQANCCGREASRKTPGSGLLSIFPGKCRTFRKCIE